jgi:type IV secretory pathway VirB4 component
MKFFRKIKNRKKELMANRYHQGVNDLLTYRIAHDDCTILHKDGAISRHFAFYPQDLEVVSDEVIDWYADTWQGMINQLNDGWMIEVNVLSDPLKNNIRQKTFPDIVSAIIDEERQRQFQNGYYTHRYYCSITWKPNDPFGSKLKTLALQEENIVNKYSNQNPFEQQDDLGFPNAKENLHTFNRYLRECIGYGKRSMIINQMVIS